MEAAWQRSDDASSRSREVDRGDHSSWQGFIRRLGNRARRSLISTGDYPCDLARVKSSDFTASNPWSISVFASFLRAATALPKPSKPT
jgi:hypothetical protein